MKPNNDEVRIGLLAAVAAHLMWGVFPLFWRQLGDYDALQVVCHRVMWSFFFLLLGLPLLLRFLPATDRSSLYKTIWNTRTLGIYSVAGVLIAINWLTFVWAVNHDRVLHASLGYYINPLLNVVMGVLLLGEKLSRKQWLAIASAGLGVAVMAVAIGGLPWVSLLLAFSFATYGLVKKKAPLPALIGLFVETTVLLLPALTFIAYVELDSGGAFQAGSSRLMLLLILGGTITIAPLALFAFAAKRAPLSTLGVLQYIGPTMQFLLGVFVFEESFSTYQLCGFAFVWLGLLIYLSGPTRRKIQDEPTADYANGPMSRDTAID